MKGYFLSIYFIFLFLSSFNLFSQAPANDDKVNAIELTLDAQGTLQTATNAYSVSEATPDVDHPEGWAYAPYQNVWFKFKPKAEITNLLVRGNLTYKRGAVYDDTDSLIYSKGIGYTGNLNMIMHELDTSRYYWLTIDGSSSTFGVKFSPEIGYDYKEYAEELTLDAQGNFETATNAYSVLEATPDVDHPAGWNYAPHQNVWFKFKPKAEITNLLVRGNLTYKRGAVYDDTDSLIYSKGIGYTGNLNMIMHELDTSRYYWLTIDGSSSTFGVKFSPEIGYDYKEYAEELTLDTQGNFETATNAYSVLEATPDVDHPAGWNYAPSYNVWFKFKPKAAITNLLVRGGMFYKRGAIYDDSDSLIYSKGIGQYGNLNMIMHELDTSRYYWLTIDGSAGGFAFGVKFSPEIGYDYKEYAEELTVQA